jgi:REP element-mobilizing transposase RayT
MTLFLDRYRVEFARLKGWDYSSDGYYFVTICTGNRQHYFGEITGGKMGLSEIGEIIKCEWQKTGIIRKNVKLDEFVVMPNHLHGILVIEAMGVETPRRGVSTNETHPPTNETHPPTNETHPPVNDTRKPIFCGNNWKPNTLGSIINQFKSVSTKRIRSIGYKHFEWQSRYYDHVIRNQQSLDRIRKYIINNPVNWQDDRMNQ